MIDSIGADVKDKWMIGQELLGVNFKNGHLPGKSEFSRVHDFDCSTDTVWTATDRRLGGYR